MRDLKLLTQKAFDLHTVFATEMAKAGLSYIVTSTLRTVEEQAALYAQGRNELSVVNDFRKRAGMYPLGAAEARKIVTWTMNSRHLRGTAFDIALIGPGGKPHWNEKVSVNANQIPDYLEAGEIGESVGLVWGGRWEGSPDLPHFEVKV